MSLGGRWCDYPVNILDDPTLPGYCGSYQIDLDGAPAVRRHLVREGVWTGLLANRAFEDVLGQPAGNGRRTAGKNKTLPRMSITWVAAGKESLEDMLAQVDDGLYCIGMWGGISTGTDFILRPAFARRIRKGRLTNQCVRGFDLFGSKQVTMAALGGLSRTVEFFDSVSGCDKAGHDCLAVTNGAPHLFLRTAKVRPILPSRSR